MPCVSLCVLTLITALSVGCRTTREWDGGFPQAGTELATEAKRDEFNKFAISQGRVGNSGSIQTQHDKDTEVFYTADSFESVVTHVSPDASKGLAEIRSLRKYEVAAAVLFLCGAMLPNPNGGPQTGLFIAGLGGLVGTAMWRAGIAQDVNTNYHRDLNNLIFGDTPKKAQLSPSLGLTFTWP